MSKWSDAGEWKKLVDGEACPICLNGKPTNIIAELDASYLTAGEQTSIKGSCTLFFKRHAVELYELSAEEIAAFMRDAQKASKAIQETTGAVKMNYEIHGNTIPHLHMHLFPRYVGDMFENQPINPRITTPPAYADGEFADFVLEIKRQFKQDGQDKESNR
jgi:diadenosine tetraphosphate (Ap4A) HIT family hydrolase